MENSVTIQLLSIIMLAILGGITAILAERRGRDPWIWFFIGMFLGLLGIVILFLMPAANVKADEDLKSKQPPSIAPQPTQQVDDKQWFYLDRQHQQCGPVSYAQIKELMDKQELTKASYVWSEGMETWKKIEEVFGRKQ